MQGGLRMYNIVVCCVSALSSSILVSKMKEVAREKGVKALIWTVGEAGLDLAWAEADVVLLTPQVRHLKEKLEAKEDRKVPILPISDADFGAMEVERILEQALTVISQ